MKIEGEISTSHRNPSCIAAAICVDNLPGMETTATATKVITTIPGTKLRSVIASVDDYLMNLGIAEETCRFRTESDGERRHAADDRLKDRRKRKK